MKITRTALVSSIAAVGMVIGGIAPTTVNAADATELNFNNGKLITSTKENAGQAYSTANVTVISGFLTLEKVPNFSFVKAQAGTDTKLDTSNKLETSNKALNDDGNNQGLLQITESRSGTENKGFDLTAQLGEFKESDGKAATLKDGSKESAFSLKLNSVKATNLSDKNSNMTTKEANLVAGGDAASVLSAKAGNGAGTYQAMFTDPSSALLKVSKDLVTSSSSTTNGGQNETSYTGQITWTLTAKAAGATEKPDGNAPQTPAA